jgi:hypothetical protein
MAQPKWLTKYLTMKPEVSKIFDDLEAWHDHCRFEMINFDAKDLYKSQAYKDFIYRSNGKRKFHNNGERKPYQGKNPRPYNERFSN